MKQLNLCHFNSERRSSLETPNSTFTLPHRPAPPIPEKPLNFNENKQIIRNVYLAAKEVPQSLLKEEEKKSKIIQSKGLEEETSPLEDNVKEKNI